MNTGQAAYFRRGRPREQNHLITSELCLRPRGLVAYSLSQISNSPRNKDRLPELKARMFVLPEMLPNQPKWWIRDRKTVVSEFASTVVVAPVLRSDVPQLSPLPHTADVSQSLDPYPLLPKSCSSRHTLSHPPYACFSQKGGPPRSCKSKLTIQPSRVLTTTHLLKGRPCQPAPFSLHT